MQMGVNNPNMSNTKFLHRAFSNIKALYSLASYTIQYVCLLTISIGYIDRTMHRNRKTD